MGITQAATLSDTELLLENICLYRVLVVDDNEACAKTMMWTMEMLGHTAKLALNGPTAIELARAFQPDLILLDIGLPGMNGYEICRAMRKEYIHQNVIFVAHTGWGQREHRERSKEAGFDYHLIKPVTIDALKNFLSILDKEKILKQAMV